MGSIVDGKLEQRELTRFSNPIIQACGHYFWDIYALYNEIIRGLQVVSSEGLDITSIGIDTWGVDVVCIGSDGGILRNPYSYRDPHTEHAMEEYFKLVGKEKVYSKTGIQFMPFNTLFQLSTMRKNGDSALAAADKILFVPDALMYMLTGEAVCEYTILSTSQMLDPRTKRIDPELIEAIGLKESQFGRYVNPSDVVGVLTPEVQKQTGLGAVPVVAVAGAIVLDVGHLFLLGFLQAQDCRAIPVDHRVISDLTVVPIALSGVGITGFTSRRSEAYV